jgi:glycosyltransferase involved in cell wall biosynthesis
VLTSARVAGGPTSHKSDRILIVGHARAATGFSRVLDSLVPELAAHADVHHLAPNYHGPRADGRSTLHPNPEPVDAWATAEVVRLVETLRPAVVLVVQTPWPMPAYVRALAPVRERVKLVAYCGIDGRIRRPDSLAWIAAVDRLVVYTEFARRVVEASAESLRARDDAFRAPVSVIPHGIGTDVFRPTPESASPARRRALARSALFPAGDVAHDDFVVLNACRNQPRKRIDLTLEGFALFARDKPDARLLLHMGLREIGWDVRSLAARLGVSDRLLLTASGREHPGLPDERLNLVYNACEVGLSTASGEGWGLAAFEHAATRAAQVVPRHTAFEELWNGAAVFVDPARVEPMGLNLEAAVVSPAGVARALERLYRDRALLEATSRAALENARQPRLRWERIARQWSALVQDLLA